MAGRLQDKVALVVGAGAVGEGWGNGKASAVLYAREGANVFAADVNPAAAAETRQIIESEGGSCHDFAADATDPVHVAAMVEACMAAYGRIDVLHNNVGGSAPGGAADMSLADFQRQFDHNVITVFLACQQVLPIMVAQQKGAIVNISSIAGLRYVSRPMIGYHTAKAGLIQYTRTVALEYAKQGIRANTVVPGLMNTPLVRERIADQYGGGDIEKTVAMRDAMSPTGKMGDAWDVAYAALYLASDEAKYVNGTEIIVDGGLSARSA